TGQLAWIDSAKRTGGLGFLELSVPAREQTRAWLSETSTASSGDKQADDAATEKPVIGQEMRVPSVQLVPMERYRAQMRKQFLRGVLLGIGIYAVDDDSYLPVCRQHEARQPGADDREREPRGAIQRGADSGVSSTARVTTCVDLGADRYETAGDGAGDGADGLCGCADKVAAEAESTDCRSIFDGSDDTHIIAVGNAAAGEGGAAAWGKPGGSSSGSSRLEGAFFLG